MGFVGIYSNVEAVERTRRLLPKLERLAAERGVAPSPRSVRKRGNAPVLKAVTAILTDADGPMRVRAIHAAVEVLRGESVASSSVKDCLASNARSGGRFVRVARGRYVLAALRVRT